MVIHNLLSGKFETFVYQKGINSGAVLHYDNNTTTSLKPDIGRAIGQSEDASHMQNSQSVKVNRHTHVLSAYRVFGQNGDSANLALARMPESTRPTTEKNSSGCGVNMYNGRVDSWFNEKRKYFPNFFNAFLLDITMVKSVMGTPLISYLYYV